MKKYQTHFKPNFIDVLRVKMHLGYKYAMKEWNSEKGYLTDICLTSQDKYKTYLDYFRIEYTDR